MSKILPFLIKLLFILSNLIPIFILYYKEIEIILSVKIISFLLILLLVTLILIMLLFNNLNNETNNYEVQFIEDARYTMLSNNIIFLMSLSFLSNIEKKNILEIVILLIVLILLSLRINPYMSVMLIFIYHFYYIQTKYIKILIISNVKDLDIANDLKKGWHEITPYIGFFNKNG